MTVAISASHSEVESFQLCERRHYYGYGERIEKTGSSEAQTRGILGHAALASLYQTLQAGGTWDAGWKAGMVTLRTLGTDHEPELVREVSGLFKMYVDHYRNEMDGWTVLEVEKRYNIKITDTFTVPMIIDLVVDTPDGITVVDHKFVYNFLGPLDVDMSPQIFKYIRALQADGVNATRGVYNQIRYRETKDNKANVALRFARQPVPIDQAAINTYMREHIIAARRISEFRQLGVEEWEKRVVRVGSKTVCERCNFKDLCVADLHKRGSDREILLDTEFRPRRHRA